MFGKIKWHLNYGRTAVLTRVLRPFIDRFYYAERLAQRVTKATNSRGVTLPYDMNGAYRAYPSFAYPLGILAMATDVRPLLCNLYINLFLPRERTTTWLAMGPQIVETPRLENFREMGYFSCEDYTSLLENVDYGILEDRIRDSLTGGSYLFANVNEYYVPGMAAYKKFDYRHPTLIYGWEDRNCIIGGYTAAGQFESVSIAMEELLKALVSRGRCDKLSLYYHGTPRFLRAAKPTESLELVINWEGIRSQLNDYLTSRQPSDSYLGFACLNGCKPAAVKIEPPGAGYGLEAMHLYLDLFNAFIERDMPFDFRTTRVLLEFTALRLFRIKYLQDSGYLKPDSQLVLAVQGLALWAKSFHLVLYAYSLGKATRAYAREALSPYSMLVEREAAVLKSAFAL